MMTLYPPMQALLDAEPALWAKSPEACWWIQPNGLRLRARSLQRKKPQGPEFRWDLLYEHQDTELWINIPRTDPNANGTKIAPILHDLKVWIAGIDVQPRARLTRQLAAWLIRHGKTGPHTFVLNHEKQGIMILGDRDGGRGREKILAPPAVLEAVQGEMQDIWSCAPLPTAGYPFMDWSPDPDPDVRNRVIWMILPTTQHARLDLLATLHPGLQAVPLPSAA